MESALLELLGSHVHEEGSKAGAPPVDSRLVQLAEALSDVVVVIAGTLGQHAEAVLTSRGISRPGTDHAGPRQAGGL